MAFDIIPSPTSTDERRGLGTEVCLTFFLIFSFISLVAMYNLGTAAAALAHPVRPSRLDSRLPVPRTGIVYIPPRAHYACAEWENWSRFSGENL